MGIRDDIAAIPRSAVTFEKWRETADTADVDAVMTAIRDNRVPVTSLIQACRKNGIPITGETIRTFRA